MKLFKNKKYAISIAIIGGIVAFLIIFSAVYVSDYYRTDKEAVEQFGISQNTTKKEISDRVMAFIPEEKMAGLIFYPGGKVEHTAYEPLMSALADKGIASVLVKMPLNLAVLDMNAADGIREQFSDIDKWYIGGHSLGGSMAAMYAAKNADYFEGLVLLGAYSTADLSTDVVDVLSIYGSEDRVMNRDKYDEYKSNLPSDFTEYIIEGGCHAGFGMYGAQKGDGVPTMTGEEQLKITAEKIVDFIKPQ